MDIELVMKCRFFMEDPDNVVMMLWERKAIEMESILKYARNKELLGMTGAMCVMKDESRGLFCVKEKKDFSG